MLKRIAILTASISAAAVLAAALAATGFGPIAEPTAVADDDAANAPTVTIAVAARRDASGDGPSLPRFVPVSLALAATPALALPVWFPTPGIEAAPGAIAAAYAPIIRTETEVVYIAPQPTPKVVHVVKRTRQVAAASSGTAGSSGGSSRSRASRGSDDDEEHEEHEEHEHEREDD